MVANGKDAGADGKIRGSHFPPVRAAGRGRGWYKGDCHVHSARSHGGELSPEQLAADAREAGLDFIAITEHNNAETHAAWSELAGDDLLVILGQEVTTQTGHWLALGVEAGQVVESRYGIRDNLIGRYVRQVHDAGGLCVAAHPYAPYPGGVFTYPFEEFDAIEVWNGLWESDLAWNADNSAAVAEWGRSLAAGIGGGRWLPAMGNSDTHLAGQIAVPHTIVKADELSVAAVLDGIRMGRSWIAGLPGVELSVHATSAGRQAGIGELLTTDGEPAVIRVVVGGLSGGTVTFHTERGTVHRTAVPDGGMSVEWETGAEESLFVRVEVRHPNGHAAAISNPIILR
jgi:hypothetical protein